ncbi:InlB B-repeat-containing protein [uncultured Treponema sp.]|uniref:InlB B-repeat-containing protein n=1 Tax=uncultured Treponema sp. TaxID=162155 RepID=UPI0025E770F1|nr:InlB B-repeat-containing protein [uncultured Treponema sp.]
MKINHNFLTPPHVIFTLFLILSLLTGCMTGDDSKPAEYKLSFSANGGTGEMESIAKEENEKINLPAVKFSKTGFEFLNWNTSADGSGTTYADGAEFTFNSDTMLHAQWTVAAENAVNAINSLPAGEHKIAVTGEMTKDNLNDLMAAIKDNSTGAKVYLDLGGITIDFYDWQKCKFADCENLIGIVIPGIESPDKDNPIILIPDLMFEGCRNLKSVIILNSSGEYKIITFKNCTSLEYVEIPTSIVCIYGDAFDGCTALETITYNGSVEQWKQVKTDYKDSKYKLMSLKVQCENGTASGSDLTEE